MLLWPHSAQPTIASFGWNRDRSKAIKLQILDHQFLRHGSECETDVSCLSLSYLVHLVRFAANPHQLMIWAGIKHQTLGLKMDSRSKSPVQNVQNDSNCTEGKARECRNPMTVSNDAHKLSNWTQAQGVPLELTFNDIWTSSSQESSDCWPIVTVLQVLRDLICGNLSIPQSRINITFIPWIFLWHASHWSRTQRATILNQVASFCKIRGQLSLAPLTVIDYINWELGATVTTMATRLSDVKQRKLTWSPYISHLFLILPAITTVVPWELASFGAHCAVTPACGMPVCYRPVYWKPISHCVAHYGSKQLYTSQQYQQWQDQGPLWLGT